MEHEEHLAWLSLCKGTVQHVLAALCQALDQLPSHLATYGVDGCTCPLPTCVHAANLSSTYDECSACTLRGSLAHCTWNRPGSLMTGLQEVQDIDTILHARASACRRQGAPVISCTRLATSSDSVLMTSSPLRNRTRQDTNAKRLAQLAAMSEIWLHWKGLQLGQQTT